MRSAGVRAKGRRRGELGSGTLLVMAAVFLLTAGAFAAVLWVSVVAAKHQASVAADLAALSAADAGAAGGECQIAARIVAVHRAELARCSVEGSAEVVVVASVRVRLGRFGSPLVSAMARAGPIGGAIDAGGEEETGRMSRIGKGDGGAG